MNRIYLFTVTSNKVVSNSDRALFIIMNQARNGYVNIITFIEKLLGNKCVKQIDNSGIN